MTIRRFSIEPWIGLEPPPALAHDGARAARWAARQLRGTALGSADSRITPANLMFTATRVAADPAAFAELLVECCWRCDVAAEHWSSPVGGASLWIDGALADIPVGLFTDADMWARAFGEFLAPRQPASVRFAYGHQAWRLERGTEHVTLSWAYLAREGGASWRFEPAAFAAQAAAMPLLLRQLREALLPPLVEMAAPLSHQPDVQAWIANNFDPQRGAEIRS